jgi:hypothetical protein
MKTLIAIVWALSVLSIKADTTVSRSAPGMVNPLNFQDIQAPAPTAQICDPIRTINGTNMVVGQGWTQFCGQIRDVKSNGVVILGKFTGSPHDEDMLFFVRNFPSRVAFGDYVGRNPLIQFYALSDGNYSYTRPAYYSAAPIMIHSFDYGTIWKPSEKDLALAAAREREKSNAAKLKALKYNQELAEKGDPYGQLRMAERYRDGDGVEIDLLKAKELFIQSAEQGNAQAGRELTALTNSVTYKNSKL